MEKITKSLTIGLTNDNQCAVSISPDTTLSEALLLVGTLATHVLNAYTEVAIESLNDQRPEHPSQKLNKDIDIAIKGIKDSMYDAFDNIASNILQTYQPDHPKYSLEDQAIIQLTNQKIQEQYDALTPEQRTQYQQTYQAMKNQMAFRKATTQHDTNQNQTNQTTEER